MEKIESKKIKWIITGIVIVLIIGIIIYFNNKYNTYNVILPEKINVEFVIVRDIKEEKEYKLNGENFKLIYTLLKSLESNKSSNNDFNKENAYLISFDLKDDSENSNVPLLGGYLFKEKNKYYFEQPYNAIFELNEDSYNMILYTLK